MFLRILLLFTLMPVIELILLIEVGKWIGTPRTVLLIIGTGIAGAALARAQGLQTLHQLKLKMSQGVFPGDQLLDGALILAGGLLLLTPGLITDAVGFLALVPGSRRLVRAALVHAVRHRLAGSRGPRPR